jgi:hypothetical protein
MHHAMNYIGFMISPELKVVQDRVHGSPEPNMVQDPQITEIGVAL